MTLRDEVAARMARALGAEVLSPREAAGLAPASLRALVVVGTPTPAEWVLVEAALLPGALVALLADEPLGTEAATAAEESGLAVWDAILVADDPDSILPAPKPSRAEKEAGLGGVVAPRAGHEAVKRKEGSAGVRNARAGAGRTARSVLNDHPCLHPKSLVMTSRGFRPISDVDVGDRVLTEDGTFQRVSEVSRHPYKSAHLYRIRVIGTNYDALASDNHPFLVWRPVRRGARVVSGQIVWVPAAKIKRGDYLLTPRLEPKTSGSTDHLGLSSIYLDPATKHAEDFWWAFGLWVAEGSVQKAGHGDSQYPTYSLHKREKDTMARLSHFHTHRGYSVSSYDKKDDLGTRVVAFDAEIGRLFLHLGGKGAAGKSLHPDIWNLPLWCLTAIFHGYIAGDGSIVRGHIQAKSVSLDVASQMMFIGCGIGYKPNLYTHENRTIGIKGRKFKSTKPIHQMYFYYNNCKSLSKPTRPIMVSRGGVDYVLSYVKSVAQVPYAGEVVNLTVEGTHTFQTAVGMSHNTVKPVAAVRAAMRAAGVYEEGAVGPVLDLFSGSGTTGIACVQDGIPVVLVDKKRAYADLSAARVRGSSLVRDLDVQVVDRGIADPLGENLEQGAPHATSPERRGDPAQP